MREKGKNRQNGTNFAVNLSLSAKTNKPYLRDIRASLKN